MGVGSHFCGHCGHARSPDGRFCGNCGSAVPASAGPLSADPAGAGHGSAQPGQQSLGAARRPAYLVPLVAVLALLVAGGGSAAVVFLHSHGHDVVREKSKKLAAASPAAAPAASVSPVSPRTQVTVDGMTINIGAVDTDPDATAVASALGNYFGGIDDKNYRQAWDTYSAALREAIPLRPLASALSTSQDSQVVLQGIQYDGHGNVEADVSFQSHQAGQLGPDPGETCTNWSLNYHLIPADEADGPVSLSYLINQVTDIGSGHTSC